MNKQEIIQALEKAKRQLSVAKEQDEKDFANKKIDKLENQLAELQAKEDMEDKPKAKPEPKKEEVKEEPKSEPKPKKEKKAKKGKGDKKVNVKSIIIHWAEGDNSKYDKFPKDYKTFKDVNKAILPIYDDIVNEDIKGTYNKVKFTVTFEDGETYGGRLDVSEKEDNPTKTDNVIKDHILDFLNYSLNDEKTSEETKKETREWISTYNLDDVPSKGGNKKDKSEKMSIPECDDLVKKWTDAYKKRQANKDKPKPTPSEKFEKKAESSANAVVSSVKGSDKEIKAEVKKDVKFIIKGLLSGFKTILMNEDEDTLKSFNKELEALIKKYKK